MITTELIKQLRDETSVSIMQCKKALEEAGGDMEKARVILKKKSGAAASKKADRELGAGYLAVKNEDGKTAIVVLSCETDFVAKNEDFTKTAEDLAEKALKEGADKMEEASQDDINQLIQKVGENVKLSSVKIIESENAGYYVHNGQIAAVVTLKEKNEDLAKDIAMHITAMKPVFTTEDDISEEAKENAREVLQKEVDEQAGDKPEEMKAGILNGKMNAYFKDQVLMKQSFIKDPSKSIEQLLKESNNALESFVLEQI